MAKNLSKAAKAKAIKNKKSTAPKEKTAAKRLDVSNEEADIKAGLMAYGDWIDCQ